MQSSAWKDEVMETLSFAVLVSEIKKEKKKILSCQRNQDMIS
jgi:hypothetical protein